MDPTLKTVLLTMFMGLSMAAVGYAFARIGRNRDRKTDETLRKETLAIEAVKERDKKIEHLEDDLAKTQRDVQALQAKDEEQTRGAIPITAAMQAMLISKLTNTHLPETDALLKKVTDKTLTVDDAVKFAAAMKERETDPTVSEAQQISAAILPSVIRLNELAVEEAKNGVKTICVTVPETETVAARDGGTQQEEKGN